MFATPSTSSLDPARVYEPAEDSYFFLDVLQDQMDYIRQRFPSTADTAAPVILELGTGSGIVSTFVQKYILTDAVHFATDINPYACATALKTSQENGGTRFFDVVRTDLWAGFRPNIVDILLFNPPYVPDEQTASFESAVTSDDWLDFALLGGKDGMKITSIVLNTMQTILSSNVGIAYILFCKRNNPAAVALSMRHRGWIVDMISERKAGWEVLSIWRFTQPGHQDLVTKS
ncbi:uncharacterized protein V1518DRAFT_411459 [Limtongia smithiae]|uniref:uncharacterized protein n=1 Tax=Limtongia smithiae TaxID=1125753 RepID=UPI0034CD2A8E